MAQATGFAVRASIRRASLRPCSTSIGVVISRIAPDQECISRQLYFPDTAILITRFMTPDGVGEVLDFMPEAGGQATDRHRLVRQLRVVRGTMRFVVDIQPRFDYGRKPHKLELSEEGALFQADGMELTLHLGGTPGSSLRD